GRSSSAAQSQRDALDALERAREAAEQGLRPQTQAQQQQAAAQSQRQEQIRQRLLELAQRNKERRNAKPTPSLEQAAQKASEAGESLDEGELGEAEQQEQQVEQQLDEALDELEKEEEQYQRLRQEELLFRIAEEVEALLRAENAALGAVREIDAARGESERLSRADRLRLRRVSDDLRQAATRTEEVASAIAAERALIFAHVFREIRQDLDRVARDLDDEGGNQTGLRTQAVLENAIETTQWALGALKDEQKRREDEERQRQQQQQQQQQEGQNQEALVPDSAELKLLRQLEVDTLEGLDRLRLVYPELESGTAEPEVLEDVLRLAERHERTSRLFAQFRERLGMPPPTPKEGERKP
ncbi:MAG: hypothetical protein NTV21_20200, partial [Planctomycetota bacterium]|nr:hypothetical protein [Planctomycetota bacterium]